METLNEDELKDLIKVLISSYTDEQILDVWREHFPEKANEVLVKPFRIICEMFKLRWVQKIHKWVNYDQNEPHSFLRNMSDLFFKVYGFNSSELDKMQYFVDHWLEEAIEEPGDLKAEVSYLVSILSPDDFKEYLKKFDSLKHIECDGVCFFFEESDFLN